MHSVNSSFTTLINLRGEGVGIYDRRQNHAATFIYSAISARRPRDLSATCSNSIDISVLTSLV